VADLKDALEGLVTHPGWLLWLQHVKSQWGAVPYARKIKAAVAANDMDAVRLIDQMNTELNALLSWPDDELKRHAREAERLAEGPSMQRGGR
jgi:hypothetical protein